MGIKKRWKRATPQSDVEAAEYLSNRRYSYTDGTFVVEVELGRVSERWEVVGFHIRSYLTAARSARRAKLTVGGLRELQLGDVVDRAGRDLKRDLRRERREAGPIEFTDESGGRRVSIHAAAVEQGLAAFDEPVRRPGRPSYSRDILERAVKLHNAALEAPTKRPAPIQAVVKGFPTSESTARRMIRRAEAEGMDVWR